MACHVGVITTPPEAVKGNQMRPSIRVRSLIAWVVGPLLMAVVSLAAVPAVHPVAAIPHVSAAQVAGNPFGGGGSSGGGGASGGW
jgi:uncharacterized membrane protein